MTRSPFFIIAWSFGKKNFLDEVEETESEFIERTMGVLNLTEGFRVTVYKQ